MPAVTTLTLEGVAYRHDDRSGTLFSDLDLTLAPGDRLAVIGANGAGKSTLLDLVRGRIEPAAPATSIQVWWWHRMATTATRRRRRWTT